MVQMCTNEVLIVDVHVGNGVPGIREGERRERERGREREKEAERKREGNRESPVVELREMWLWFCAGEECSVIG